METGREKPKLVVILGPTASGKSSLAMEVAKRFDGEIITADSQTIYKGMDIGTAKPSVTDRNKVPHWGLDLRVPGEDYSAAEFKDFAKRKIIEIVKRKHLPILVGGSGLYIDAVIFDFSFISEYSNTERLVLDSLSLKELQQIILCNRYKMPLNHKNRRHLISTIARKGQEGGRNKEPPKGTFIIGLLPPDKTLKENIAKRAERMFQEGIIDETKELVTSYGEGAIEKTGAIVYRICLQILNGHMNIEQGKELFKAQDWQYARRQRTWFRRNKYIQWFESADAAFKEISKVLNNKI